MDSLTLLEEAIEAERNAYERYRDGAENAEDPQTRALLAELAADEAGHEERLRRRLKALKLLRSE